MRSRMRRASAYSFLPILVVCVTVFGRVQRFTPLLADAARFCRHSPGDRWMLMTLTHGEVRRREIGSLRCRRCVGSG